MNLTPAFMGWEPFLRKDSRPFLSDPVSVPCVMGVRSFQIHFREVSLPMTDWAFDQNSTYDAMELAITVRAGFPLVATRDTG